MCAGPWPEASPRDSASLDEAITPRDLAGSIRTALSEQHLCWVRAPCRLALDALLELRGAGGEDPALVRIAGPPTAEGSAFGPFRPMLRDLVPLMERDAPDVVSECGPELVAVLPDLRQALAPARGLDQLLQLPTGPARMLPRESEYVFRIAMRLGWALYRVAAAIAASCRQPPVFGFVGLDRCDRPTLLGIHNLCLRATGRDLRIVLAAGRWPGVSGSVERSGLFDAAPDRLQHLDRLFRRWPGPVAAAMPATSARSEGGGADGPSPPGGDEEAKAHRLARAELRTGGPGARVRAAFDLSYRWFNPEAILDLADAAARAGTASTEVFQAAGTAHATMGNYAEATDCFEHGHDLAQDPVERARMAMFMTLVAAKRTSEFERAGRSLAMGYAAIDGQDSPGAALERGWLMNVEALLAYRNRDHARALQLTQAGLESMRPHGSEEAIALKTNLVANASIVFETVGNLRRALETWRLFLVILDRSSDVFVKYYRFREAGLLMKAGSDEESAASYERAFELAHGLGDLVTAEGAARALALLASRRADPRAAASWAERLPPLLERMGDRDRTWRAWMTVAAFRAAAGDGTGAVDAVTRALEVPPPSGDGSSRCLVILERLRDRREATAWDEWMPEPPPTAYRYPARLFEIEPEPARGASRARP